MSHSYAFTNRIYIEKDGIRVEIGDGYSVGPGHGLIVSKIGDNIRVFFQYFTTYMQYIMEMNPF